MCSSDLQMPCHLVAVEVGIKAFANGDYESALVFFKSSKKSGLNSTGLHHNLGATYFRLKLYGKARQEFERLLAEPGIAPLAHYNLGRIALAMGEKDRAIRHFKITLHTAGNTKLRRLARDRLRRLTHAGRARAWSGYLSFAAGYDDNVALVPDNDELVDRVQDEFLYDHKQQLDSLKSNGY